MVNVKNPQFRWFNLLLYNTFLYRSGEELGLDLDLQVNVQVASK